MASTVIARVCEFGRSMRNRASAALLIRALSVTTSDRHMFRVGLDPESGFGRILEMLVRRQDDRS